MQDSVTYQAIIEEGRQEGAHWMALQTLSLKLGNLTEEISDKVRQLSISQLPALGIALQDFKTPNDLD